jgi:hypothetical protein
MNDQPRAAQSKKPYRKPEILQVPLRPEEAVLGGCKSATHGGQYAGACVQGSVPCSNQAS